MTYESSLSFITRVWMWICIKHEYLGVEVVFDGTVVMLLFIHHSGFILYLLFFTCKLLWEAWGCIVVKMLHDGHTH